MSVDVTGATSGAPTRVLVVDDHLTFAELLSFALNNEPDLDCVGHAQTSQEGIELVDRLAPDVVLMDVELPDTDGVTTTARLVADHPQLRVVVLTAHASRDVVRRAASAGACGVLPKDGSLTEMLHALRNAKRGSLMLQPDLLSRLVDTEPQPAPEPVVLPDLTPREQEVLQMLGEGLDPRGISRRLGISLNTCRGYIKNLLLKLGVHSQLEAVVVASRQGLIKIADTPQMSPGVRR